MPYYRVETRRDPDETWQWNAGIPILANLDAAVRRACAYAAMDKQDNVRVVEIDSNRVVCDLSAHIPELPASSLSPIAAEDGRDAGWAVSDYQAQQARVYPLPNLESWREIHGLHPTVNILNLGRVANVQIQQGNLDATVSRALPGDTPRNPAPRYAEPDTDVNMAIRPEEPRQLRGIRIRPRLEKNSEQGT